MGESLDPHRVVVTTKRNPLSEVPEWMGEAMDRCANARYVYRAPRPEVASVAALVAGFAAQDEVDAFLAEVCAVLHRPKEQSR